MQRQLLTEFVYDLEKSNAQTFNVLDMGGLSTGIQHIHAFIG